MRPFLVLLLSAFALSFLLVETSAYAQSSGPWYPCAQYEGDPVRQQACLREVNQRACSLLGQGTRNVGVGAACQAVPLDLRPPPLPQAPQVRSTPPSYSYSGPQVGAAAPSYDGSNQRRQVRRAQENGDRAMRRAHREAQEYGDQAMARAHREAQEYGRRSQERFATSGCGGISCDEYQRRQMQSVYEYGDRAMARAHREAQEYGDRAMERAHREAQEYGDRAMEQARRDARAYERRRRDRGDPY